MPGWISIAVAAAVLCCIAVFYLRQKKNMRDNVRKNQTNYHVPLSDDVQKIYFDEFEKEKARQAAKPDQDQKDQK